MLIDELRSSPVAEQNVMHLSKNNKCKQMLKKVKIFCSCLEFLSVNFSSLFSFCDLIIFRLQLLRSRMNTTVLAVLDLVNANCKLMFKIEYEVAKWKLSEEDKQRKEIRRKNGINSIKLWKLQTLSLTVFLQNSSDNIDAQLRQKVKTY